MAVMAHVLRDLEQPRQLVLRDNAASEPALRIHEGRLHGILRVLSRAEPAQTEAEDPRRVPFVQ
jgi:hypothetical protein